MRQCETYKPDKRIDRNSAWKRVVFADTHEYLGICERLKTEETWKQSPKGEVCLKMGNKCHSFNEFSGLVFETRCLTLLDHSLGLELS